LGRTSNVLGSVVCGGKGEYAKCPLISEATDAKERIPNIEEEIEKYNDRLGVIEDLLKLDVKDDVVSRFKKINSVLEKKKDVEIEVSNRKTDIANKNNTISKLKLSLDGLMLEKEKYDESIEQKERNKISADRLSVVEKIIGKMNGELSGLTERLSALNKKIGSNTAMMNEWISKKSNYEELMKKYSVYNVLLECLGKGGISHKILSDKLPVINATINNLLNDVVTFRIELCHEEGSSISVNLKYPDSPSRPLSIASGMEKVVASLAIRAGLCLISNLPRSSTFIVDEGFGTLDINKVADVEAMFKKLKKYFTSIIVVTHVPALQDVAEVTIDIGVDDNHNAYIEV